MEQAVAVARRTAVAAPAPPPSADELLEMIARLPVQEFIRFRDLFRKRIAETEPRPANWIVDPPK